MKLLSKCLYDSESPSIWPLRGKCDIIVRQIDIIWLSAVLTNNVP